MYVLFFTPFCNDIVGPHLVYARNIGTWLSRDYIIGTGTISLWNEKSTQIIISVYEHIVTYYKDLTVFPKTCSQIWTPSFM